MREQILDQKEVDALLQGLSGGLIGSNNYMGDTGDKAVPYDLTRQVRCAGGRMPGLEMINEKFCSRVRTPLSKIMGKDVEIEPEGMESVVYGEFMQNLILPSSINVFAMPPLKGQGILVMDPGLVYLIVDNYFGGTGRFYTPMDGREFTQVEQSVIRKVVDVVLKSFSEQWQTLADVEFKLEKSEMNPHFVNVLEGAAVMMVSAFRMEIEPSSPAGKKNKFFFCIPRLSVEPIREKLQGRPGGVAEEQDENWSGRLCRHIERVPLHVAAEVGEATIKLSELLSLKTGDVIILKRKIGEPFDLRIEGSPRFRGRPGISSSNYALEIQSVINKGE